ILCTRTMAGLIAGTQFDIERMARAVGQGHLLATEVADWLAARGVPFRQAHAAAGALVRVASARGVEIGELSLADLRATVPDVTWDESLFAVLDAGHAVDRRDVIGGPARARVQKAIEAAERELGE
ncbi:MAG TPA: argininosuccinate lyase, partial [Polyangia bacterium]